MASDGGKDRTAEFEPADAARVVRDEESELDAILVAEGVDPRACLPVTDEELVAFAKACFPRLKHSDDCAEWLGDECDCGAVS